MVVAKARSRTAWRCMVRTITRSPIRAGSTPEPTATMRPQQSAPWMRGKLSGAPDQLASASSTWSNPAAPPLPVSPVTALEYQPILVLISVLLRPAAATRISTSPGPGSGTATSSR